MKRYLWIIALGIVVAALLACGSSSGANVGTTATSSTSSTPTPTSHFKVGDVVTVGSTWKVTVNGISTDGGGQYSSLKTGDTYALVDVSMTNLSSTEQNVSSLLDFTFKDGTGQKYDQTVDTNASGSSPDGKVEAGDTLRGTIAYEVPMTQKAFTLAFAPDLTSSGQTIWDLSIP